MSKRKVDPMAQAIRDLKYLERVVKALEVLRGADARVRALMGTPSATVRFVAPWACGLCPTKGTADSAEMAEQMLRQHLADGHPDSRARAPLLAGSPAPSRRELDATAEAQLRQGWAVNQSAILDTPERQEYEAAKREGRIVPDPFADPFRNATPEQRERMAEQKAAIAAEKARRGLPAKIAAVEALNEAGLISPDDVETVVSTEELATGANGSFGAAVSVTATDEKLSPEDAS